MRRADLFNWPRHIHIGVHGDTYQLERHDSRHWLRCNPKGGASYDAVRQDFAIVDACERKLWR